MRKENEDVKKPEELQKKCSSLIRLWTIFIFRLVLCRPPKLIHFFKSLSLLSEAKILLHITALLKLFSTKVYGMNFKVWKYIYFSGEVSDGFAGVAKDLYQINPVQNILSFQDKIDYFLSMNPPMFFWDWHLPVVAKHLLIYIHFINIHDKLFPVLLQFLEGPQLPATVFVHGKSIEGFVFTWKWTIYIFIACDLCASWTISNVHRMLCELEGESFTWLWMGPKGQRTSTSIKRLAAEYCSEEERMSMYVERLSGKRCIAKSIYHVSEVLITMSHNYHIYQIIYLPGFHLFMILQFLFI